jgi:hypothetical protein
MDIYEIVKEKNIPFDHHESDLYVKKTRESTLIIRNYEFKDNVTIFTSDIDGTLWYDIPFAYTPFYKKK